MKNWDAIVKPLAIRRVLVSKQILRCRRGLLGLVLALAPALLMADSADLILHNARIYTVDSQRSWAEAVAVKDGKFVYVGEGEGVSAWRGPATRDVDLQGRFVLPGMTDAHVHPVLAGVSEAGCPVFELETRQELLAAISRCVSEHPDKAFIYGAGWRWDQFVNAGKPHKNQLDKIDSSRPLIFGDADGHTLWLNSAALTFAGVSRASVDPPGGEIVRDPVTGEPSGLLLEDSAMNLLLHKLPAPTAAEMRQGVLVAQRYLNSMGITAIQDAQVKLSGNDAAVSLPTYRAMADAGELTLRVVAALYWEPDKGLAQLEEMQAARKTWSGGRLQATAVKFWADGILESHTAMMLEPYTDKPSTRGLLMVPREQLLAAAPLVDAAGFQLHIHAIGSATVRYALDAIAAARTANPPRDARHHIAHVQMVHPDDVPRFGQLDVTANFQPYWAYGDSYVIDINSPQLGPQRMQWMYPIAAIAESGGHLAFGSDWSVSTANPFPAMEIAITRQDADTSTTPVFLPEQRISLQQAIEGYTIGAAYTNFLDDVTGSIEVGKYADLVVVDRNLFAIPVTDISAARVLVTMLEGEEVFGKLSALAPAGAPVRQ